MIGDKTDITDRQLRTIADMLVINGSLLGSSGLWYGKMGAAIFFFHYARYAGNELFEDYAVEIIQAIQAEIHKDSATDYDCGLAGIGAGIEYLSQNGFLAINTNEILADFDRRIRHDIMCQEQENNSLADGMCGWGSYLLYRLNGFSSGADKLYPLIKDSIIHTVNLLEKDQNLLPDDLPDILSFLSRLYPLGICNSAIDRCMDKIWNDFSFRLIPDEQLPSWTLALLRLAPLRSQSADIAVQAVDKSLQAMEAHEEPRSNRQQVHTIHQLLWLLQCKRLISQTNLNLDPDSSINAFVEKKFYIKDKELELSFEKGKLSLKGYAGFGLAMMTLSGKCDDTWLDLLG